MLFKGFAYGFYLYDAIRDRPKLSQAYAQAEAKARANSEGLWPFWLGEAVRSRQPK